MSRIMPSVWGEQPRINAEVNNACPANVQYKLGSFPSLTFNSWSSSHLKIFIRSEMEVVKTQKAN